MISPLLIELARCRTAELQRLGGARSASRVGRRSTGVPRPRLLDARRRAGFWLVTVGTRLAASPAEGAR